MAIFKGAGVAIVTPMKENLEVKDLLENNHYLSFGGKNGE